MQTRRLIGCKGMVLGFAMVLLAGCDNPSPATIKYEQRGACNGFTSGGVTTSAGGNQAYVVFRVSTVANTGAKPVDFNFDPARLYVDQTNPTAFANPGSQLAGANPFTLLGRLVKAGTTETFNGAVVVIVPTTDFDGAKEASQKKYKLLYSALTKPGAQTEDTNPGKTSWGYTPNCTQVTF